MWRTKKTTTTWNKALITKWNICKEHIFFLSWNKINLKSKNHSPKLSSADMIDEFLPQFVNLTKSVRPATVIDYAANWYCVYIKWLKRQWTFFNALPLASGYNGCCFDHDGCVSTMPIEINGGSGVHFQCLYFVEMISISINNQTNFFRQLIWSNVVCVCI